MYQNILIPVLLDEEHDATASFEAAQALADQNANFTVLHVIEAIPAYVTAQIPDAMLADTHATVENQLKEAAAALPGAKAAIITGHAGAAIVEYVEDHKIDCVIVASHRPGFQDFFLGSTASRVVRHASCSVHVIR